MWAFAGIFQTKQLKNQDKMKKTHIGMIAAALIFLASCTGNEATKETSNAPNQAAKTAVESTPPKDPRLAAMDSIYNQTEAALNAFISEHGDGTLKDVWWDSKKAEDMPYKRVRLCPIAGSSLIIERRPYPFTKKLEVLGYSISKEQVGDSYKYVVEASRFEKNVQVKSEKEDIGSPAEMQKAVAIFQSRLQEARDNVAVIDSNRTASIKHLANNG